VPPPKGSKNFAAYIKAELLHSSQDQHWKSKTVKCKDVLDTGADIMWNESFEWEFEYDELTFVRCALFTLKDGRVNNFSTTRLLVKESEFGEDEHLAVFCARLSYLQEGWRLIRLLDMRGKNTGATALVRFRISEVGS
jgi:phosphatidylinositol phospholipase C delta